MSKPRRFLVPFLIAAEIAFQARASPVDKPARAPPPSAAVTAPETDSTANRGPNWTTRDKPCAHYANLRSYDLNNIGVKLDDTPPEWRAAFRQAFNFLNPIVQGANFHEDDDLSTCVLRVLYPRPSLPKTLLHRPMFSNERTVADSQFTDRRHFKGMIGLNHKHPNDETAPRKFEIAVHEMLHMLLDSAHDSSCHSIMFPHYDGVCGTPILGSSDLARLGREHRLTPFIRAQREIPVARAVPGLSQTYRPKIP